MGVSDDFAAALARKPGPTKPRRGTAVSDNGDGTWQVTVAGDSVAVPVTIPAGVSGVTNGSVLWLDYTSDASEIVAIVRLS